MVSYNNRDLDKAIEYASNIQDENYSKSDLKDILIETGFDLEVSEQAISKLEVEKNRQIRHTHADDIQLSAATSEAASSTNHLFELICDTNEPTIDFKRKLVSRLSVISRFARSTIVESLHDFKPLFYLFAVLYLLSISPMQASFHEFANTKIIVLGEELKLFNAVTLALKLVAFTNVCSIPLFLSLYALTSSKKYLSRTIRFFTGTIIVKYLVLVSYIIFQ